MEPDNGVQAIARDLAGRLWVATAQGLALLDPKTDQIRTFHEESGLTGERFLANATWTAPDGRIFFGGFSGFLSVDPTRLPPPAPGPAVAVTGLRVFSERRPVGVWAHDRGKTLELGSRENFFTFDFVALDYVTPEWNLLPLPPRRVRPGLV